MHEAEAEGQADRDETKGNSIVGNQVLIGGWEGKFLGRLRASFRATIQYEQFQ